MTQRSPLHLAVVTVAAAALLLLFAVGCETGMEGIDRRVDALLDEGSGALGSDAFPPGIAPASERSTGIGVHSPEARERPTSVNPTAGELPFHAMQDAGNVLDRLEAYNQVQGEPLRLDLRTALRHAFGDSREYAFAEEEYVLAALRLLTERHRWGPRFFDEIAAEVVGTGDDGFFDTSLQIVNEFRVTQRLPYGGEISARALARATEDLHSRVAGGDNESAEFILAADIPLLRGAGLAAREDLIQRERDLIYAAREFEEFRRDFLFDIVQDFLDLVVQQRSVSNAERQVTQLRLVEQRERALYESGRSDLFNAALAEQSTVSALDELNQRRESYRLDVDRFKVRLNIPVAQPVAIVESDLSLPVPQVELEDAVRSAMAYRLDLQTQRDVVDDSRRSVAIARNQMLPDLNVGASLSTPSDDNRRGFRLEQDDSIARAGVTFGLPLDREIERLSLRQSQIQLERAGRAFDELRDNIAVNVRGAVRAIDRARYQLQIQERNIQIGEDRIESIESAPDRATARDSSEAADDLLEAMDRRDSAMRDLELAILAYLLQTGQLRVTLDGQFQPLRGMELRPRAPVDGDFFIIPGVLFLPRPPAVLLPLPGESRMAEPAFDGDSQPRRDDATDPRDAERGEPR